MLLGIVPASFAEVIFLTHHMTLPSSHTCFLLCKARESSLSTERTAGATSQQVSPATKGKSKDLQPPYNVVITGGTKGAPSFDRHMDCLTPFHLSAGLMSLVQAHKELTWPRRRWEGASYRVPKSRGLCSDLLKKRCALT